MRFREMAINRIGSVDSVYEVQVVPEPLRNPTFHFVCRDSKRRFKAIIQIADLKLVGFESTPPANQNLSRKERKTLLDWLKQKPLRGSAESGWQWLIDNWNTNNWDNPIDENMKMPDIEIADFLRESSLEYLDGTITIREEVRIGNYILEPGDRIQVVKPASPE